jgi:hypothetical protein
MNTALWVLQGFLAVVFLLAAALKLLKSQAWLVQQPHCGWTGDVTAVQLKLIGLAELAGSLGLVLPEALGIAPILTPVAAGCLTVQMLGAVGLHRRRKEPFVVPAVTAVLTAIVCAGRFM